MSGSVTVGDVVAVLRLKDELSAQMANACIKARSELKGLGKSAQDAGKELSTAVTLPLVAAGAAAIKFATDMNRSMANVATLIPGNTKRVQEFKGEIQDMAIKTGIATDNLAGGLYEVISSLGDTADTMKILEINAKAGAAGLASTQDAIKFTSAVTKTYGDISAQAFQQVSDLGFQAVNLGQTTFPELAASIGGVAPLAKETGVSMQEMFAILATATGVTGNTAEVTTQMAAAITALVSPTAQLKEVYKQMNVSGGEALIRQKGLVGAMQAVAKAAKDTGQPLIDLVGRKEAWIIASSMAGSQATVFTQKLEAMKNVAGATETAFKEQTQGINKAEFTWKQLQQTLVVAAQKMGDELLPILGQLLTDFKPLLAALIQGVHWFGQLPGPVKNTTIGILALLAAVGPLTWAFGGLVKNGAAVAGMFATVLTWVTQLANTTPVLTARVWLLDAAGTKLGTTLGFMGKAVAAVAVAYASFKVTLSLLDWTGLSDKIEYYSLKLQRLLGIIDKNATDADLWNSVQANTKRRTEDTTKAVADNAAAQAALAPEVQKALDALKNEGNAAGATATQFKTVSESMKEHTKKTAELNGVLVGAIANKASLATLTKLYGNAVKEATGDAEIFGTKVPGAIKQVADAMNAADMKKAMDEFAADNRKLGEEIAKDNLKVVKERQEAWVKGTADLAKAYRTAQDELTIEQIKAEKTVTNARENELKVQLANLKIQKRNELAEIANLKVYAPEMYAEMVGMINEKYKLLEDGATKAATDITEIMHGMGVNTRDELTALAFDAVNRFDMMRTSGVYTAEQLAEAFVGANRAIAAANGDSAESMKGLAGMFQQLSQIAGGTMGSILSGAGGIAANLANAQQSNIDWNGASGKGWGVANPLFSKDATSAQKWSAGIASAGALVQGGMNVWNATGSHKTAAGNALGGAMAGAQAGAAFGPWGMAIGAAAGLVVGIVRGKPEWAKAANDVGHDFGVKISDELAKTIAAQAKSFGINKGQAATLNMSSIIKEGGGLNATNILTYEKRAVELFDMMKRGGDLGSKSLSELDSLMGQFAENASKTGGLVDTQFIAMMKRAQAEGNKLGSVVQFVDAQTSKLAGGLEKTVAALASKVGKELDKYAASLPKDIAENQDEANKLIAAKAKELGAGYQVEFDRMARMSLGAFNTMVANGKTAVEAIAALGPSIDSLIVGAEKFGFQGGAAFDALKRWRELVNNNQELLASVSGLNDMMIATANLGAMDKQAFADFQAQGLQAYNDMIAAGFSQSEAAAQMKPTLETIIQLHKDRGLAIDAETQKILDQAVKDGVLKKEQVSTNDILLSGIGAMIEAVGGKLPEAFRKYRDEAALAAQQAKTEFEVASGAIDATIAGMNKEIRYNVVVDQSAFNGVEPPEGGGSGDTPGYAGGTHGQYINFGSGTQVTLHGYERVMTAAEGASGGRPGVLQAQLILDGRVAAETIVPLIPGVLDREGV